MGVLIDIQLRVATEADRATIFGLLEAAAWWLRERDVDYWQNWLAPPVQHVRWVDDGVEAGEFRIIESSGADVGCVRLQDADPLFWGHRDDSAWYIHSLTTDRSLAGRGVGASALMAVERSAVERGAMWLRLDCGEGCSGLRRYYESLGFAVVGQTVVDGEGLVLYQRPIGNR